MSPKAKIGHKSNLPWTGSFFLWFTHPFKRIVKGWGNPVIDAPDAIMSTRNPFSKISGESRQMQLRPRKNAFYLLWSLVGLLNILSECPLYQVGGRGGGCDRYFRCFHVGINYLQESRYNLSHTAKSALLLFQALQRDPNSSYHPEVAKMVSPFLLPRVYLNHFDYA